MDITNLINLKKKLSFDFDVIDFHVSLLKMGCNALRVTADRVFTDAEVEELATHPEVVGAELVAEHEAYPEARRSYFYIKY